MNRLSEDQLVARLRHDIPRSDLLQAVTAGIGSRGRSSIPSTAIAMRSGSPHCRLPGGVHHQYRRAERTDLSKFYDSHPDLFRAPEYRGFTIASLSPADLEQPVEIAEDELRKEYEQRKDEFETPDRREIQQILAPSEEKAKEAEAALAAGKDWKESRRRSPGRIRRPSSSAS